MPVPKQWEHLWGEIYGHALNSGKSKDEARRIADQAIKDKEAGKSDRTRKGKL
jgi:hypothetical protein